MKFSISELFVFYFVDKWTCIKNFVPPFWNLCVIAVASVFICTLYIKIGTGRIRWKQFRCQKRLSRSFCGFLWAIYTPFLCLSSKIKDKNNGWAVHWTQKIQNTKCQNTSVVNCQSLIKLKKVRRFWLLDSALHFSRIILFNRKQCFKNIKKISVWNEIFYSVSVILFCFLWSKGIKNSEAEKIKDDPLVLDVFLKSKVSGQIKNVDDRIESIRISSGDTITFVCTSKSVHMWDGQIDHGKVKWKKLDCF